MSGGANPAFLLRRSTPVVSGLFVLFLCTLLSCALTSCAHPSEAEESEQAAQAPPEIAPSETKRAPIPALPTALPSESSVPSAGDIALAQLAADAHDEADHAGTKPAKTQAARHLFDLSERHKAQTSPTALAVRQDMVARASMLALAGGEPELALKFAGSGLALSESPTLLRANLLIAQADSQDALGKSEEMRESLLLALKINQELMTVELENP